jgi:hypothetical protein
MSATDLNRHARRHGVAGDVFGGSERAARRATSRPAVRTCDEVGVSQIAFGDTRASSARGRPWLAVISPGRAGHVSEKSSCWRGSSVWRALWWGEAGQEEGGQADEEPESPTKRSQLAEVLHGIEVFSAPWNLLLSAAIGMWLMAAPSVLGLGGAAADSTHITGALVVTVTVIAFAEPARLLRYFNLLGGLWLLVTAWLLNDGSFAWHWISPATGLALIAVSLRCGPVEDRYGGWQRFIR